jgi:hypothetical protein
MAASGAVSRVSNRATNLSLSNGRGWSYESRRGTRSAEPKVRRPATVGIGAGATGPDEKERAAAVGRPDPDSLTTFCRAPGLRRGLPEELGRSHTGLWTGLGP